MNTYIFKTTTTMKEYNSRNWWIDSGIIREKHISADTVKEALKQYQEQLSNDDYMIVSDTAIKNKSAMYVDTKDGDIKQVGYVITGKCDFQCDDIKSKHYGNMIAQYVDLWVTIITVTETIF